MTSRIAAIDFETANTSRNSACSVGLVLLEDGQEIASYYQLIKPRELYFDPFNISIHGITEDDVRDQPTFDVVWKEIQELIGKASFIAHNASFDMSVLRYVLDDFDIPYPKMDYGCTCNIARKAWPELHGFKLNIVSEHLNIQFEHHNALEDARACAEIYQHALNMNSCNSLHDLALVLGTGIGELYPGGYRSAKRTVR